MSEPIKVLPMAQLLRQAREKERAEAEQATTPVYQIPPTYQAPPTQQRPPTQSAATPLPKTGATQQIPPIQQRGGGYTRITHDVADRIIPTLDVYSQTVLQRLLRLSWGYQSETCQVGLPALSRACNISQSQARRATRTLIERGLLEVIGNDFDNRVQTERGTKYRILLEPAPTYRKGAAGQIGATKQAGATYEIPNKEHTLKETHTNTEGVRVSSRFSLKECRQYADSLKSEGIQNPGGYATKIHRTGEADELIERFLSPPATHPAVDASQCPECQGSGWWYPKGPDHGVARCKHPSLEGTREGKQ